MACCHSVKLSFWSYYVALKVAAECGPVWKKIKYERHISLHNSLKAFVLHLNVLMNSGDGSCERKSKQTFPLCLRFLRLVENEYRNPQAVITA